MEPQIEPIVIDTVMHGRPGITGCFVVAGEQTALVETGPKSRVETVLAALDAHGIDDLDWIVVTHIHLDHAGAAGTLAQRFPGAQVAVHEVGAPHLVDPSKLWSSAARIYGEQMEALWGGIDPIDEGRIRILADGDVVDLGGRSLTAVETPGHARHHHCYLDSATGALFTGDALGVRLPDLGVVRPATPPPEFNLGDAVASIEKIRSLRPERLILTHFGPADDAPVGEVCDDAVAALRQWESWVRTARAETEDLDAATAVVKQHARAALEEGLTPEQVDRMDQTTSYRMNTWGYMRYLDRQEGGGKSAARA